ncbi:hypothetical protein SAY87_001707 [Trapa incisa]|uniref:Uncharacterized protein n=1 Tax=Trapa incisa TaxID=236973 RepID=A0AAN7PTW7_9MYRT|nr:hypothetical protein SAY87_001707 [Trapa incisa]
MAEDTTNPSYWLNATFLLCAIIILLPMLFAAFLIWKLEEFNTLRRGDQHSFIEFLYKEEPWRTCLKGISPSWLMAYRVLAFAVLSTLITCNIVLDGGGVFFFYTQWTFTLVTIYFGLGSAFSVYGCFLYHGHANGDRSDSIDVDPEQSTYVPPSLEEDMRGPDVPKTSNDEGKNSDYQSMGFWNHIFQIVYQIAGGAVILTDSVFWLILYPLYLSKGFAMRPLNICLHSLNAVFLLGDAILNDMRFPMFRIAYFILWTCTYVIFQWIIHACVSLWWPYPFLNLKSPYAPLWYVFKLEVALCK